MDNRKIDGSTFSNMVISGANALNNDQQVINDLNVFPVPDGDTGANMSMTLEGSAKELSTFDGSVSDVAEKAADTSLRSARGNSGAILSLFFRGMAKSLKGKDSADSTDIAAAFESGTKEAYKAVSNPQEGTILTVMRACSEEAKNADGEASGGDIGAYFERIVKVAENTLEQTPEMLEALKQAQVVDAGGSGFVTMLKGMYSALLGKPVNKKNNSANEGKSAAAMADGSDEAIRFAYCTECIVDKDSDHIGEGTAAGLRSYIEQKGDSVVFVDDELLVKFHVHTNHPGKVIEQAIKYGSLTMVKVENMRLQHSGLVGNANEVNKVAEPTKRYGAAAVCIGDGLVATFKDLGVDSIILGGQTMNPSTQDILDAVNRTPSEIVFLFPNNKNICMVAEQAKKLCTEKQLVVIPTVSVPQGIAALMQFDDTLEPEEIEKNMNEACTRVTSMSVTYAIKDTTVENREIKKGQAIGIVNGKIKFVGSTSMQCFRTMMKRLTDASYVIVMIGKDIAGKETTEKVNELLAKYVPQAECSVIDGGQPLYDFIVSVE